MKITKLTLTNFRSFKDTQVIDFAPVTLLFGPNSVGKSTVLMALFYVHHILSKGDCNPIRLENLNDKYVGGFKNLVHGRDLKKPIKIGIEYKKENQVGSSYSEIKDVIDFQNLYEDNIEELFSLPDASGNTSKVNLDLTISWSPVLKNSYVSSCSLAFDGVDYAYLDSQADGKNSTISAINYLHPILIGKGQDDWLFNCFESLDQIHPKNGVKAFKLRGHDVPQNIFEDERDLDGADFDAMDLPEFTSSAYATPFHEILNEPRILGDRGDSSTIYGDINDSTFVHEPIAFRGSTGAIPKLGTTLKSGLEFDNKLETALINEILSDSIVAAFDNLLSILDKSLCIGPLRTVPDPNYQPNSNPQTKDWYEGIAAWDVLAKADLKLLRDVDYWMEERLKLGYGIAIKHLKTYSEFKKVSAIRNTKSVEDQLEKNIKNKLNDEDFRFPIDLEENSTSYTIWDKVNHIEVFPSEIGVGVSQLLPFVVAALNEESKLVAIEQPELHVHPRVQVEIGDLVTQLSKNTSFLIETHSEHLILRILKRIEQTTEKELPDGVKAVSKDDVSIVYLEPSENGVRTTRIQIDDEGKFIQYWPDGFFEERRKELL